MKSLFSFALMAAAALSLSACGITGSLTDPQSASTIGSVIDATGAEAPAPLANTLIDEKGVLIALESADTLATSVDMLVLSRTIIPGSPRAKTIKKGLIALRSLLVTASAAQKAGNTTSYRVAMSEVAKAFREVAAALKPT